MVNGVAIARWRKQRGLTQQELAERADVALDTLCRLEQGRRRSARLSTLERLAGALRIDTAVILSPGSESAASTRVAPTVVRDAGAGDMKRRDLLRLVSTASAAIAASSIPRRSFDPTRALGVADVAEIDAAGTDLWAEFAKKPFKTELYPEVRRHLDRMVIALRRPQSQAVRIQLHTAASAAFQLAGEVLFDADQYNEAAQCYTLAATAAREAGAMDLWSCAMTRHAYLSLYDQRPRDALPLLELATELAHDGDCTLSTQHWSAAVLAQALAGIGDCGGSERSLDAAERVRGLTHPHNGGWLRFDGSRLPEDRATCYLSQQRPDLAEPILTGLLAAGQPGRRRGLTLVELARAGTLRKDPVRVVTHGFAALEQARHTGSAVVGRRLHQLRPHLQTLRSDPHIRHLDAEIAALSGSNRL